jgi:regulator of replication initiation timing
MCECCGGDCKLTGDVMDKNDLLTAYREIYATFDDFTQSMRRIAKSGEKIIVQEYNMLDDAKNKLKMILEEEIFIKKDKPTDQVKTELSALHDNLWELWAAMNKSET